MTRPIPSDGRTDSTRLAEQIVASGNLGITAMQLSRATGVSSPHVVEALRSLERRKIVTRIGRGLWIQRSLVRHPARGPDFVGPEKYLKEFCRTGGIRPASYSGELQFRPNTEEAVHRWWPYVQGFSAGFVRSIAGRYGIGPGRAVLDPYAGSGTVPVVARAAGAASTGIELMPISAFIARAKQHWTVDPRELARAGDRLLRSAPVADPAPLPFLRATTRQFASGPLESLRRLKTALDSFEGPDEIADLLRLSFAEILIPSSRMRRSPCLGYGPKPSVPRSAPVALFRRSVDRIVEDLARLEASRARWGPRAEILEEDSRSARLRSEAYDLAVTSPPYVNGMDYVMNYKVELAWLDLVRSYDDLRALKERMVACDNLPRVAARRGWEDPAVTGEPWLADLLARMRRNLAAKQGYRRGDMDGVVASYFADLRPTIARVFSALRPGGRFVVVNGDSLMAGTYLPGDLLFGRLAVQEGFEVESLEVARVRRSGQRREFLLRESILTLRRPT